MPGLNDWQREIVDSVRRQAWTLRGPNQVVKVVPSGGVLASTLGGYITLGRFLVGKTPLQIEKALGLPLGYLATGARIYRFARLPQVTEYEYELTAEFPDGLAYNPASDDPSYLPGDQTVHQWRIRFGVQIPVDANSTLDLKVGQIVPYHWLA